MEVFEIIRKYNFWEGQSIQTGLKRELFLDKLVECMGNRLIKVLIGQRRSGKSYLMRQTIHHLISNGVNSHNILYINKEFTEFDFIRNEKDLFECIQLYLNTMKPIGKVFLFIDEVQWIENWEKVVNSFSQDYTSEFEVFISGFNSTFLSGGLATLLSGRYLSFQVFPYSFSEYCKVTKAAEEKPAFVEFITRGALPELFHLHASETKLHYIQDLKNTIILKDIVFRHKIQDVWLLELIFTFLVQNISNPVSIQNIVNYFHHLKITSNYNTISAYIGYLKETYIIHEVSGYDLKGKKIIGGNKKYYLNDLSFRNLLYPGFEPGLGYLLENAVFLEFKRNGYEVFTGADRSKEVDFVVKKGNSMKYVQVCYLLANDEIIRREFGNLEGIRDNYDKMVVSLDDVSFGNKNGIDHFPAWKTEIYR